MMNNNVNTILICVSTLILDAESNGLFSSTSNLQRLIKREQYIIQKLENAVAITNYGQSMWARKPIETYLESYHDIFKNGKTEEEVSYHPVDAFHFLKHVTKNFEELKRDTNIAEADTEQEPKDAYLIDVIKDVVLLYRTPYPGIDELERTGASIVRMREVYQIPFDSIIDGRLQINNKTVFQSSSSLNSWDCYIIGEGAVKYKVNDEGILWLMASEKLRKKDGMISEKEIQAVLKTAEEQLGDPEHIYSHDYTKNEEALCRGETIEASLKNANLVCRYLNRGNAYLLIGPMKLEEKSRDPPIMIFHDFAYDPEIKRFQMFAKDNLELSVMQEEQDGEILQKSAAFERTSDTAWLFDDQDVDLTHRLSRRIDAATNLDTGAHTLNYLASQPYQVVNYGVAGVYVTHTDYLEQVESCDWVKYGGDRIVTILIYLSDVELGGATVFPLAGVTIPPERGAAAVWYNVRRNGDQDYQTRHTGCPVIYGSKWISNKWIMMYGQMLRQKCGLEETEKFDLP